MTKPNIENHARRQPDSGRSSLMVTNMAPFTFKFSIKRLMLGTGFVGLTVSAFETRATQGLFLCIVIAVPMFVALCIASRDQLLSMLGILGFTILGLIVSSIVVPTKYVSGFDWKVYLPEIIGSVGGFIAGLYWSENFYAGRQWTNKAVPANGESGDA